MTATDIIARLAAIRSSINWWRAWCFFAAVWQTQLSSRAQPGWTFYHALLATIWLYLAFHDRKSKGGDAPCQVQDTCLSSNPQ